MSDPHPGNAAPTPSLRVTLPFGKRTMDPAARVRRRVGGWVRELAEVGATMANWMLDIARWRHANDRLEHDPIDLDLGYSLLRQAMRWLAALRARLAAESKAARTRVDPLARLFDRPDRSLEYAPRPRPTEPPEAAEAREAVEAVEAGEAGEAVEDRRDDCIDGISTGDVVAKICAALDTAAGMLDMPRTRGQIAEIAAAARRLLGEGETALPPAAGTPVLAAGAALPVFMAAVAPPAPSPDTG